MLIRYGYTIEVSVFQPTPFVTCLDIHPDRRGDIVEEDGLALEPPLPLHSYIDGYGNLCHLATMLGLSADPGSLSPLGFDEDEEIDPWYPAMRSALVFGWNREPKPLPRPSRATSGTTAC